MYSLYRHQSTSIMSLTTFTKTTDDLLSHEMIASYVEKSLIKEIGRFDRTISANHLLLKVNSASLAEIQLLMRP
jgi:DNA-binding GntR family transcriptional regulator